MEAPWCRERPTRRTPGSSYFIAGNDVKSRLETEFSRRPVREGVESGGVLRPLEELVLVDYDLAWTVEHHDSILMSWAFYLGGGEEP